MKRKLLILSIISLLVISSFGVFNSTSASTISENIDCGCNISNTAEVEPCAFGLIPDDNPPDPVITFANTIDPPSSWDWRSESYGGKQGDWTTPIKSQGHCDNCCVFPVIALLETALNIAQKNPNYDLILSEQYITSCGQKTEFASGLGGCSGGQSGSAFAFINKYGAIPESKFPYTSYDGTVADCSEKREGWKNSKVHTRGGGTISPGNTDSGRDRLKCALVQYGPLAASMRVYQDFYGKVSPGSDEVFNPHYPDKSVWPDDIYYQKKGDSLGLHAVTIVGYNDDPGYWICKNSWGTGWGLNGWFKIAYDECEINGRSCYYYSHLGDSPICPARAFTDISGEYLLQGDDISIRMSKEDGECNADYTFDIGVDEVIGPMKIFIEYIEYGVIGLGPSVYIFDGNSWEQKGDWPLDRPQSFKWNWVEISNPNDYIKDGLVKVRVHASPMDDTILRNVKLKYSVDEPDSEPELKASGDKNWGTVKPGSTQSTTISVKNVGGSDTTLKWKASGPSWGSWDFNPSSGEQNGIGSESIDAEVTAPDETNSHKTGYITVLNTEDKTDYGKVEVELKTGNGEGSSKFYFINLLQQILNRPGFFRNLLILRFQY